MAFPTVTTSMSQLRDALTQAIGDLRSKHEGLITVICPTNTTSVLLRRQFEQQTRTSLGIRFTTLTQVNSLLEDAALETSLSARTDTVAHFDTCATIARQLFPQSSAWVKAPLIKTTLELLHSMDDEFHEQALNDYELVRRCADLYAIDQETRAPRSTPPVAPVEDIVGTCIIVGYGEHNQSTRRFMSRYSDYISYSITGESTSLHADVHVYETAHDEIDATLENVSNIENLMINSCALIVPSNEYKRLVINSALRKNIPLAGSSPTTIASHPFCELAYFILTTMQDPATSENIRRFVELFPWMKNPTGKHPFIPCRDAIARAQTVGEYFTAITEIISNYVDLGFFEDEDSPPIASKELTQSAFSLLQELSHSISPLTYQESALLLKRECEKIMLRINPLGSGIYVALPSEVFGSAFDRVFICGMNDAYVSPTALNSSLIPRDQYERYEVSGKTEREQESQNILSWLRNCSSIVTMSSSHRRMDGKIIVLPYWAHAITPNIQESIVSDFSWDEHLAPSAEFVIKLTSRELNNVNAMSSIPEGLSISASGIGDFAQCPSQFLHRHIFKATTPLTTDDPDDLLPNVLGTFIHDHLERYIKKSMTKEELIIAMREHVFAMVKSGELPHIASSVLTAHRMELIFDNFFALHEQARANSIDVEVDIEKSIQLDEMEVLIRGKIDRIQTKDLHTTFVDYKTGKKIQSADRFHFGRKLQLALYALSSDTKVDEIAYWYLGGETAEIDTVTWDGAAQNETREYLFILNDLIAKGVFLPRNEFVEVKSEKTLKPSHRSMCDRCEAEPFCYREQQLLWPRHKSDKQLESYAQITGEKLFEDVNS